MNEQNQDESDYTRKRIEVESLLPGDVFEYEHRYRIRGGANPEWATRLRRDTVTRSDHPEYQHMRAGSDFFKYPGQPAVSVFTQDGENHHGYVILLAKTVVVRLDRPSTSPGSPVGVPTPEQDAADDAAEDRLDREIRDGLADGWGIA